MRILVVMNLYPPHSFGGYEQFCLAAVDAWRAAGHEVLVLTSDARRDGVDEPDDTHVRRVLPIYLSDHEITAPSLRERVGRERRTRQAFESAVDELRPDVVSVWNLAALSTGLLAHARDARLPVVAVVADEWPTFAEHIDAWRRPFVGGPARRAVGMLVTRATGLPTRTPSVLDLTACYASGYLRERLQAVDGWPARRSTVVPFGVDLATFSPQGARSRPWSGRLLITSRIDRRKGLATAIRALAQVDGAVLEIANTGDPGHRRELDELAESLGVTDRLVFDEEPLSRRELRDRYRAADAVLFPSEWNEPFGLVPLEAMACGTPTIATGTGGSGEFLRDEDNCLRFEPRDESGLAAAISRLAADTELREDIRRSGLETVQQLSQSRALAELEAWHVRAVREFEPQLARAQR